MSSSFSTLGGVVVNTKHHPQKSSNALSSPYPEGPAALGIVQMLIGLINIGIGTPLTKYAYISGGIVFWGGLVYMSSGLLTLFAEKKLSTCLMMNFCSIFSICFSSFNLNFFCESYDCEQMGYKYQELIHWIIAVLLVFSILQFIISVCESAFACRAMCDSSTEQVVTIQTPEAPINTVSKGCLTSSTINPHDIIYASSVGPSVLKNYAQLGISSETEPSKLQ